MGNLPLKSLLKTNGAALHRPEERAEKAAYSFSGGKDNGYRDEKALVINQPHHMQDTENQRGGELVQ